jgi:REP element-mobilizing transposase RayT
MKEWENMPRSARKRSETGIYHVMVRGINRQEIFHDDEDCQKYLETLEKIKKESSCEIYAYCLMGNHLHLLIREGKEHIEQIMKRIGISYAYWYNWKYEHFGHVFQDRYKSECVNSDGYLMTVIRYIHNNPVKAGMVKKPELYKWSSCRAYYGEKDYLPGLTQTSFALGLLSENNKAAIKKFRQFNEMENDDRCLEDEKNVRASDEEVYKEITKMLKGKPISTLQQMERMERDRILREAKDIDGSSIRQIARITGIGYNIIIRA